jgi:hypothetical protein
VLKRVILAGGLLAAMLPATALAGDVNQGDASKVKTVENLDVDCAYPVPSDKVEGDMGRSIHGTSSDPIDKVTVKSGKDAEVVYSSFYGNSFYIKLSKDVSNYVVWTCPCEDDQTQTQNQDQ